MRRLVPACLLATTLAGCGSTPVEEPGRTGAAVGASEVIPASQLPAGARVLPAQSLVMGAGEAWVGRLVLELPQGSGAAYAFFLEQYPQQGWSLISAVRGKTSLLVFTKAERSATVELADGGLLGAAAQATLTVAPRSTQAAPAVRRP